MAFHVLYQRRRPDLSAEDAPCCSVVSGFHDAHGVGHALPSPCAKTVKIHIRPNKIFSALTQPIPHVFPLNEGSSRKDSLTYQQTLLTNIQRCLKILLRIRSAKTRIAR